MKLLSLRVGWLLAAVTALVAAACGGSSEQAPTPTPTAAASATSVAATATADISPTPGNDRGALGDATSVPSSIEFADAFPDLPDLERATAMAQIPGERRMLVLLQDGRIVSFDMDNASELHTVLDFRGSTSRGGNEEGMLGVAFDPAFAENGYVYLYYNVRPGERRTQLSRFEMTADGGGTIDPASELQMLTIPQPYANHNGGQLAFGPDGMLYLGLGDGGSGGDPHGNGQDLASNLLGSIVRIDVRGATAEQPYRIPPDNPFADGRGGARPEIWAYGFRNPWRFSFDRETGDLWAADVGERDWEEIDIVRGGGNYGWNIMEGSECFRSGDCDQDGLTLPVAEYSHDEGGCSVTGGYVYRGQRFPELRGVYLYADYCSGQVWGLLAAPAVLGEAVEPVTVMSEGPRISSFAQDADGELYMLSFDGRIYGISGTS